MTQEMVGDLERTKRELENTIARKEKEIQGIYTPVIQVFMAH